MSAASRAWDQLAEQMRADLDIEVGELRAAGEEIRSVALAAADVAAQAVIERLEGRDTALAERALRVTFQALGAAASIELAARVRSSMAATIRRIAATVLGLAGG